MARTYVITGAGSGIGKKTAEILRERGETVVGVDLKGADIVGDLGTPEGRKKAVADALAAANNKVDAVIACAGISHPIPATAAINYFGMTEFLEGIRPVLAQSEAPRAALISSMSSLQPQHTELTEALLANDEAKALEVAGRVAEDPKIANMIYASSKRAISRWVRQQSVKPEWAGAGIPLNAVAPGVVVTPMTADLLASEETTKYVDAVVPMPLNYHQPPESIANLLIWLTSVENTHCAGQTIYCDGGADVVLRGEDAWSWADERVEDYFSKLG